MADMFNKMCFYLKIILLLIVFVLTLFISFMMIKYNEANMFDLIRLCIPMFLILSVFVVSFFFQQGDSNTIFNVACIVAFTAIIIVDYRSIFDNDMVEWIKYQLNFYFFRNQIIQIKILSYLIFIGNILLIYKEKMGENKHKK